jgi:protein-S-isoprenylcysteine O-methyltransferase Ste14
MDQIPSTDRVVRRLIRARWVARAEVAIAVVAVLVALSVVVFAPTMVSHPYTGDDDAGAGADLVVAAGLVLVLAGLACMVRIWRRSPEDGAPAWHNRRRH